MLINARNIVLDAVERHALISHQLNARLDFFRRALDQLVDLLGGLCRALGKFAGLLGNNSEALTCLARSCSLETCIERKQVCLKRNLMNDTDNVRSLFRGLLDLVHRTNGLCNDLSGHASASGGLFGRRARLVGPL